jgi:hypothetical protein
MVKRDVGEKKKRMTKTEMEERLIDNFIALQKVLTNLSMRFEDLSKNLEKMLELFEISARSFTEKYSGESIEKQPEVDQEFLKKLDVLLEQNKTIAKGIMLMEDNIKGKQPTTESEFGGFRRPLPRY